MFAYLKHIDWKVVVLTLLTCYVVPTVLVSTLLAFSLQDSMAAHAGQAMASFSAFLALLVPPVAGGYVAARFARRLPRLQVMAVGVLGAVLSLVAFRLSPRAMVVYAVASIALAALGGFIRLRSVKQDEV
jgi:MFS family permease